MDKIFEKLVAISRLEARSGTFPMWGCASLKLGSCSLPPASLAFRQSCQLLLDLLPARRYCAADQREAVGSGSPWQAAWRVGSFGVLGSLQAVFNHWNIVISQHSGPVLNLTARHKAVTLEMWLMNYCGLPKPLPAPQKPLSHQIFLTCWLHQSDKPGCTIRSSQTAETDQFFLSPFSLPSLVPSFPHSLPSLPALQPQSLRGVALCPGMVPVCSAFHSSPHRQTPRGEPRCGRQIKQHDLDLHCNQGRK